MRATLVVVLIAGVFFLGVSVVPRQQVALHGSQAVHLPVRVAAHRIATYAEERLPACFRTLEGGGADLTRALVAVEYVSVSRIEHALEYMVAHFAQLTGAPLPDLSYGAAQVRPSTLARLRPMASRQARDYVNDCASIAMAQSVIASLLEKHRRVVPSNARLMRVIRDYTGQLRQRPQHVVHNAIVAQLYADYRS
ncbi:MAG TPA: hypothetical protein VMW70_13775 [Burkholderiales bacterium]|nr:hypothetical protein [Burkholderiales bacterium]